MSENSILYPERWKSLRVALAHDWLTGMRGGEKCLELLAAGLPQAPLYCLIHRKGSVSTVIENRPIHTSILQHIPGIFGGYRYFLPLFPLALRTLGAPEADLLLSTSHCAAKGLRHRRGTKHLCYCFTPMRYAWTFQKEYFGPTSFKRAALALPLAGMRAWDRSNSRRVDHFVAISRHVQQRIERFYHREADVVYPPVDTDFYTPEPSVPREDFDLVVSALVPYKRVDLAVTAYSRSGRSLVVVGTGTEYQKLKSMAGPGITFLGWQPNEKIRDLYRRCRFLVFPGEEDFGIVPPEAMACGTPVLAFRRGGATETVAEGVSGAFFDRQDADALETCRKEAENRPWDPASVRGQAEKFAQQAFIDGLDQSIQRCINP